MILPVFSKRTHSKDRSLDSSEPGLTRGSVCKQQIAATIIPTRRQGKTIRDKPPPNNRTARELPSQNHSRKTTGRPLGLCRNGSHLANPSQTLPVNQSIFHQKVDRSHTRAYSVNQYAQQLYRSERRSILTSSPIYTKIYLCLPIAR